MKATGKVARSSAMSGEWLAKASLAAVLAMLAACNGSGSGESSNSSANVTGTAANATENTSAGTAGKDPAAAATAAPGQVTREFLVGRWTDNNDCNNTITFATDGTFTVPGGASGVWALDGDRLTFQGAGGTRSARVQAPDANTLLLLQDDGSIGRSTRCTN